MLSLFWHWFHCENACVATEIYEITFATPCIRRLRVGQRHAATLINATCQHFVVNIHFLAFVLLGSPQPYYRVVSLASKRSVLDDILSATRSCQNWKSLGQQIERSYLAITDNSCQETTLTYVSRMSIFFIQRNGQSYVFFLFHWLFCFNSGKVGRKRDWEELERVAWKKFNVSVVIKMRNICK